MHSLLKIVIISSFCCDIAPSCIALSLNFCSAFVNSYFPCHQGNASAAPKENGFTCSFSLLSSEKAVEDFVQQPLDQGIDDHLFEFSEALRSMMEFDL